MIKTILFILFTFIGLGVLIGYGHLKKSKYSETNKDIFISLILVALLNFCYALTYAFSNLKLHAFIDFTCHAINLAIVFFILTFLVKYSYHRVNKKLQTIVFVILILNAVTVYSNLFYPWAVDFEIQNHFGEDFIILVEKLNYAMEFKQFLPILMSFAAIYILIKESLKTKGIFRVKYLNLLILMVIALVFNIVIPIIYFSPVNSLVVVNTIVTIELAYLVLYHLPKVLEKRVQAMLARKSSNAYVVFDSNERYLYSNSKALDLFNLKKLEEGYKSFCDLVSSKKPSEDALKYNMIIDGEKHYFKMYHKVYEDESEVEAYYFVFEDITKEYMVTKEMNYVINHDALTGAFTRGRFIKECEERVKEEQEEHYVIATNFENFRLYNELYSTDAGDNLLIELAKFLDEFRKDHEVTYARMGSDKFGIFITKALFEEFDFANMLINRFKKYEANHTLLRIGVCPLRNYSITGAFERAVQTMHYYHGNLTSRVEFYSSNIKYRYVRENLIISAFDESLKNKEFQVYYQPQMNSLNATMFGAEALVRWENKDLGKVSPAEFVPVFEKKGVITKLDLYVWEESIKTIKELNDKGYSGVSISINISRRDFFQIDVYQVITNLCQKYGVKPHSVKLEITESVFTSEQEMIVSVITKLQNYGFLIEMDDFGSGYSSLNILKEIPIDIIKLDMEFLRNSETNKGLEIIDSVISMAHRLKLPVIAEGIETKEHVEMLLDMGCNLLQGYYYSKPLNKAEFEKYVSKQRLDPVLDSFLHDEYTLSSFTKDVDKFYGLFPDPIVVLTPIYGTNREVYDLVVIYQNNAFDLNGVMNLGNIVGKNISSLDESLDLKMLTCAKKVLEHHEAVTCNDKEINGKLYQVLMYPLQNSDNVVLCFK